MMTDIPEFPLFDVDDVEMAFGAERHRYFGGPSWDGAKRPISELSRILHNESKVFQSLMFKGGRLEDYGRRVKPDLDKSKVFRALTALMSSWGVSHEQKTATVALAIHHWTDPLEAEAA